MTVPLLWPRSTASVQSLIDSLRDVGNKAHNVPVPPEPDLQAYVTWATDAADALQPLVHSEDIDRLIRTPMFWAALSMPLHGEQTRRLIQAEMRARRRALQLAVESLELFLRRFTHDLPTTVVVPDTNILLEHPTELTDTDWHELAPRHVRPLDGIHVAVPLVVVDELDDLKRQKVTRTRARSALKQIYMPDSSDPSMRKVLQASGHTRGPVLLEVVGESPGHVRLPRNDDEIINVAARLRDALGGTSVVFATYDTGAALRATAAGLPHQLLVHPPDD